jgi:hypothetical protein
MKIRFDRETGKFVGLDKQILRQLIETYPGVDLEHELKRMALWLLDHPKRVGSLSFISNWLSRAPKKAEQETVPDIIYAEYLERLWQGRGNLFLFNTKQ